MRCFRKFITLIFAGMMSYPGYAAAHANVKDGHVSPAIQINAGHLTISPEDGKMLSVRDESDGFLGITIKGQKERNAKILLKQPIAIPAWAESGTFILTCTGQMPTKLRIDFLVEDAEGRRYLVHCQSPGSFDRGVFRKGVFKPGYANWNKVVRRFTADGLDKPDISGDCRDNFTPLGPHVMPKPPYKLLGFNIWSGSQARSQLYLKDIQFTALEPSSSKLYYQLQDRVYLGELNPSPSLCIGDLSKAPGQYRAIWELFSQYDGSPVGGGEMTWEINPDDPTVPLCVQLARTLNFPITKPGTWWIRLRVLRTDSDSAPIHREYRLYVIKGTDKEKMAKDGKRSEPASSSIAGLIQVAPSRQSRVFDEAEPFVLPIVLRKPNISAGKKISAELLVQTPEFKTIRQQMTITPHWNRDNCYRFDLDLSKLAPGPYQLTVSLRDGKRTLDEVKCLIGRKGDQEKTAAPSSTGSPSWKKLLEGKRPLFHLSPMVKSEQRGQGITDWEFIKPFMDQAPSVSRDMELMVRWSVLEPLPGLYNWEELDRILNYAHEKGLSVLIWPGLTDPPEWMPSYFTQGRDGSIFGQNSYTFHGARVNLYTSDVVRKHLLQMWKNLALRYRNHPALQGYYIVLEHPGDAPYLGWYEGFEPETIAAFVRSCRKEDPNLSAWNHKWMTKFNSWNDLRPPKQNESRAFWLDWMRFRASCIDDTVLSCQKVIRRLDPDHLIMIYGDVPMNYSGKLPPLKGCMLANGGSHCADSLHSYPSGVGSGYQERTEDHSPGQWSGYFPYQLDASVFTTAMSGGKAGMHCKAFMYTNSPYSSEKNSNTSYKMEQWRKPPYSLDRYEKFMPIWTELRQTETLPGRMLIYRDLDSYLLAYRTTYMGYFFDRLGVQNYFEAQIPFATGLPLAPAQAPLLLLTERTVDSLPEKVMAQVESYVRQGGTLLMRADAGKNCLEHLAGSVNSSQNKEWVLLRRFGFTPPKSSLEANRVLTAVSSAGGKAASDLFKGVWRTQPQQASETIAVFKEAPQCPAISHKTFGKGQVFVMWAKQILPRKTNYEKSLLRKLADGAGVVMRARASTPMFWMNLLRGKDGTTYYGLVHYPMVYKKTNSLDGKIYWNLPTGRYAVEELINGRKMKSVESQSLWKDGMGQTLKRGEVAIYRFTPLARH